jgi:hypothetical protein
VKGGGSPGEGAAWTVRGTGTPYHVESGTTAQTLTSIAPADDSASEGRVPRRSRRQRAAAPWAAAAEASTGTK